MTLPRVDRRLLGEAGFRNFLYLTWRAIGLPEPTPIQYDIADWLQHGPKKRGCEGFRGVGKSYITAAYVCWRGLVDPSITATVVSASKGLADDFTTFVLQILEAHGELTAHLLPDGSGRASKVSFDYGCAPASRSPSVMSRGIFSSNTGGRADIVICDDVVSWANSQTQAMRDRLSKTSSEFDGAILKPGGDMVYLYTMQTESDPAHELPSRGYNIRYFPAEVPDSALSEQYGDRLSPYVQGMISRGAKAGTPTDPLRFPESELLERRLAYGTSMYRLQYLLDHNLADEDRYPLKVSDLIIDQTHDEMGYERLLHCRDPEMELRDLVCVGRKGDRFYRPLQRVGDPRPYQGTVMFIDPSGRGTDETGVAVVSALSGMLFVRDCYGLRGGFDEKVLNTIAATVKLRKVNRILVESNFGGGMFAQLLTPVLQAIGALCEIEEVRSTVQKERRIADVLEPLMNQHRLVVDPRVISRDHKSVQDLPTEKQKDYQLVYQMSRLTREKGCLRHDDRLDALAGACAAWVDSVAVDAQQVQKEREEREHEELLKAAMTKNGILGARKRRERSGGVWYRGAAIGITRPQ